MSGIIAWFTTHEMVLGGLVVAVIDFVFSISPAAASSSLLEWILKQAEALVSGTGSMLKMLPKGKGKV